ncbi:IclR family transcriptional regulator [Gryllotalpicola ginsengisoli]|uniref:IclR family transcriptional regulator n=1 Tax=Gryllotalpicola ginsengisoli TaxID=444608 RepID=UPI0003B309FA|nr:IclR family transcriptional regulator [Gryllotalpicola ginsengisoli]
MAGRVRDEGDGILARTARLLGAFTEDDTELSAAQLADRSGLARSTAHRLARELTGIGFLARTDSGAYTIGTTLWEIGELSPLSMRLREPALPILERLYEASGENVHLAVLDGDDPASAVALYVARLTGESSIPTLTRMGGRLPLHATGVGKALLMTRDEAWLSRYFQRTLERETVFSVTDERRLRAELATARRLGYASTKQEMTLGNYSVAVPLGEVMGLPPAAVGVVSHLGRSDERRLAPIVARAARDITAKLRSVG